MVRRFTLLGTLLIVFGAAVYPVCRAVGLADRVEFQINVLGGHAFVALVAGVVVFLTAMVLKQKLGLNADDRLSAAAVTYVENVGRALLTVGGSAVVRLRAFAVDGRGLDTCSTAVRPRRVIYGGRNLAVPHRAGLW